MPAAALNFLRMFAGVAAALTMLVAAAVWLIDPYGASPLRLPIARPIMDINQRYMYPQIARSGGYDSVVIGTSTSRLLDPKDLERTFSGRFANLAMNAATAWEQTELARLYLRHQPRLRAFIVGLDQMWCFDEKSIFKTTFRGFPAWMYDENPWNDLVEMLNLKTVEITGRLLAHHAGLMPERIRSDGYEVFTPPEWAYDAARARMHIWGSNADRRVAPVVPPATLTPEQVAALRLPALDWLDELLGSAQAAPVRIVAFMPVHVSAQPAPGSESAALVAICRDRIAAIAERRGARFADFAIPSDVTRDDASYWDPLHYRLPIASRIVAALGAIAAGREAADGLYVLRR